MKNLFQLIIACVLFTVTPSVAQINDSGMHGFMKITTKESDVLKDVVGSAYLNDEFQSGMITLEGKDPLAVLLRYDINTETFEVKTDKNSEDIYVLPVKENTVYHLGPETFVYKNLDYDGGVNGYFKVYFEGDKVSLLEKPTLDFIEPVKAQTGYQKDKPGQIITDSELYLVLADGTVENVRLREKDFKKALPSSKALNKYLSDNKLKTTEDFVKMLDWYEEQAN